MLMITGIDTGYDSDTFITEFIEENPQIKTMFGPDFLLEHTSRNISMLRCDSDVVISDM
ncbi:hypothetical protein HUJ04_011415 [Dendroctonus ponderosae]|nr:hypothetical protein HUJ04_011415 [Dendroctonus ponderosae]